MKALLDLIALQIKFKVPTNDCISCRVTLLIPKKCSTNSIKICNFVLGILTIISTVSISKPKNVSCVVGPAVLSSANGTQISLVSDVNSVIRIAQS